MADLRKNLERGRFEVHVDGELAGFTEYEVGDHGEVTLPHTEVDERFGGRGLAGVVVKYALDDIRAEGYLVHPECPYVKKWLARHPDYADMVAPEVHDERGVAEDMEDVAGVSASGDPRI